EDDRGGHALALEAEILGVNVATDGGEQLAALSLEDMPPIALKTDADEAAPVHETVHLARPRDILAAIAAETAADAAELFESVYPSTSQDSFDRQDEITDLATSSHDIDLDGFWMSGYGALADYDLDHGEYGFKYVELTYPDNTSGNEKRIRRRDLLRLANTSERSGVRFAMSEVEARSLRAALQGADAPLRARLAVPTPVSGTAILPLTAELVELVVLRPGSDPKILNDDEVIARIGLEQSSSAQPNGVAQSDDGSAGGATADAYDVLGLRVGQPLAEGLALAQTEFEPETTLYGHRDIWIDANVSRNIEATTPLAESVILVRKDARDFLTIFHEPLVEDDPITGIARTIMFAEGSQPRPEAIRDLLVEKYGEIGSEEDSTYLWSRTRQAPIPKAQGEMSVGDLISLSTAEQYRKTDSWVCGKQVKMIAFTVADKMRRSRAYGIPAFEAEYPLVDDAREPAPHPEAQPLWPINVSNLLNPQCDTDMVVAAIQQDDSGLVAALRVLVTSRAYVANIKEAAQAALLKRNAAEQMASEIDF
ncbi:hypothetical protein KG088_19110, partial [Halomonas sp. TRM85114]|uniref:hypothetical protein n=1 Tax=Halomonas jincaotanensis TaxID=2810616 RepID=UPI001BD55136